MSDERPFELEIVIRGRPGSGKTRTAHMIGALLAKFGFASVIHDPYEPPVAEGTWRDETIFNAMGPQRAVTIRTECTRPAPKE